MTTLESVSLINKQIQGILDQLSDSQYSLNLDIFNGSSVGMHIRHIFDFYDCIISGCNCDSIDYNDRDRNPNIEQNRVAAIGAFSQMASMALNLNDSNKITVITDFSIQENDQRPAVTSSIGRELMYAYDHAVHHLAIIKIGIKASFPDVILDKHIGVAPSTIKYQSKN
jgi:hypothetical protein